MDLGALSKNYPNSFGENANIKSFDINMTIALAPTGAGRKQNKILALAFLILIVGIVGNFLALVKLARKRNSRSGSYTLILRCLTTNNLIGLMGIAALLILKSCLSQHLLEEFAHWFCAGWVIFRFFGISSGCIAVIMSIDRYVALSHPIYYQKYFTSNFNRNAITILNLVAAVLTFLPFVGFGIYFDEETGNCLRYREAETLGDRAYAIIFFVFGTLICFIIVTCNIFVIRFIVYKSQRRNSYCSCSSSQSNLTIEPSIELRFSKLMAFLSLSFVISWMPQMVSILLALKSNPMPRDHWFFRVADILMALNFTLDPYVYVLSGKKFPFSWSFLKCWGSRGRSKTPSRNQNRTGNNNNTIDCIL